MNQHFEDLMYQAGLTAQGSWDLLDQYDREAILKFGQLVVESCVETCDEVRRIHARNANLDAVLVCLGVSLAGVAIATKFEM
jgi:hypothetical protein